MNEYSIKRNYNSLHEVSVKAERRFKGLDRQVHTWIDRQIASIDLNRHTSISLSIAFPPLTARDNLRSGNARSYGIAVSFSQNLNQVSFLMSYKVARKLSIPKGLSGSV